jgi:hypothetical protein
MYAYCIVCISLSAILSPVKPKRRVSSTRQRFWNRLRACWPALKGSLALVHKPCIRPNCRACASGKKHPNYLLAFSDQGQRRCLYVPTAMVPVLKRALKNGRQIEQLLYEPKFRSSGLSFHALTASVWRGSGGTAAADFNCGAVVANHAHTRS